MNGKTYRDKYQDQVVDSHPDGDIPDWKMKEFDDIQKVMDAFKTIIDFTNVMGRKPQVLAEILEDVLVSSHRTLQQGTMAALIQLVVDYADFRSDGRNEYTVEICKLLKSTLDTNEKLYQGKFSAPVV